MLDEFNNKFYWGDKVISLTDRECQVLDMLIWNKGRITQTKDINKLIFNSIENRPPYRAVHSTITQLREKLGRYIDIRNYVARGYYINLFYGLKELRT